MNNYEANVVRLMWVMALLGTLPPQPNLGICRGRRPRRPAVNFTANLGDSEGSAREGTLTCDLHMHYAAPLHFRKVQKRGR